MQMLRIVFAGALLFGVGCELPEEEDLTTDERVVPANLDDSTDYALFAANDATDYAIDEGLALSSDVSEEGFIDEEQFDVSLSDDELLGEKKWKCCYCWEDDDDNHDKGKGDDECYCAKDYKKKKAKKKAKYKCEDEHEDGCEFKDCYKKGHDD
ncbi:MAG TPA: hypothetical protein VNM90_00035 [Haliangium sp.]|nr:hypothetical protein [Haliangium sp.]